MNIKDRLQDNFNNKIPTWKIQGEAADYIERLEAQLEDAANSGAWETGYNRGHTDALEEAAKTEEER